MSGVVSRQFGLMVPHGKLEQCITYLEDGLRSLKSSPYHAVLGKTFLHEREELGEWVADFARKADAAKVGLKALYLEMNGFTINPGRMALRPVRLQDRRRHLGLGLAVEMGRGAP